MSEADGLREHNFNRDWFEAWCAGRTGYPLIDACMRAVCATGYLNFRMRAMLVSLASYDLWLHWREPGVFLARQWLDYEPGIHYSQMQMQAGTTGINTVRIYDPTKQAYDQDPDGEFIRRWVPELASVPQAYIHEPWRMPTEVQHQHGCVLGRTYPLPIIDHTSAARLAHTRIAALRRLTTTQEQSSCDMEAGRMLVVASKHFVQGRHINSHSASHSRMKVQKRRKALDSPMTKI